MERNLLIKIDLLIICCVRKWQPTPVFLPGESQGQGSLVGCRLWGRTESDTTEATQQQHGSYLDVDVNNLERGKEGEGEERGAGSEQAVRENIKDI